MLKDFQVYVAYFCAVFTFYMIRKALMVNFHSFRFFPFHIVPITCWHRLDCSVASEGSSHCLRGLGDLTLRYFILFNSIQLHLKLIACAVQ